MQNQDGRHSQKRRGAEPGGHRLDRLPFLILDEAQEVVLGARSLVLPEDAVLTAASITDSLSLTEFGVTIRTADGLSPSRIEKGL